MPRPFSPYGRFADSEYIMMERGFFSHSDPLRGALSARLHAAGIQWTRCGENIFREKGLDDPPDAAVEGG